jgi:hypothetical protein
VIRIRYSEGEMRFESTLESAGNGGLTCKERPRQSG